MNENDQIGLEDHKVEEKKVNVEVEETTKPELEDKVEVEPKVEAAPQVEDAPQVQFEPRESQDEYIYDISESEDDRDVSDMDLDHTKEDLNEVNAKTHDLDDELPKPTQTESPWEDVESDEEEDSHIMERSAVEEHDDSHVQERSIVDEDDSHVLERSIDGEDDSHHLDTSIVDDSIVSNEDLENKESSVLHHDISDDSHNEDMESDISGSRRASGMSSSSYESERRHSRRTEALIHQAARDIVAQIGHRSNRESLQSTAESDEGSYVSRSEPASNRQSDAHESVGGGSHFSNEEERRSLGNGSSHHENDDDVFSDHSRDHSPRSSMGSVSAGSDHKKAEENLAQLSESPRISGISQYEMEEEFVPTIRGAPRPAFRSPSSVKALQMSSPPPSVLGSPRSSRRFPTVSRLGSPGASAQYSPKKTPPRFKRNTPPLVLLHVTLLPLRWGWGDVLNHAKTSDLSQECRALREGWQQLQDRMADTTVERGILLPHPQDDYETLEERLLEALELPMRRRARILECGHYLGPSNITAFDEEFNNDEEDEEDDYGRKSLRYSMVKETHWCTTCRSDIRYESLGPGKIFRVKVYASNGLMKAGAWAACWKEMERVDVEIEPIVEVAVEEELGRLEAQQIKEYEEKEEKERALEEQERLIEERKLAMEEEERAFQEAKIAREREWAEEEERRLAEEERRIAEEEERRFAEEQRRLAEAEERRLAEEKRLAEEEQRRLTLEEEQRRAEEEARRLAEEEEERRRIEEEEARIAEEEARIAEEERQLAEEERVFAEEQERLNRREAGLDDHDHDDQHFESRRESHLEMHNEAPRERDVNLDESHVDDGRVESPVGERAEETSRGLPTDHHDEQSERTSPSVDDNIHDRSQNFNDRHVEAELHNEAPSRSIPSSPIPEIHLDELRPGSDDRQRRDGARLREIYGDSSSPEHQEPPRYEESSGQTEYAYDKPTPYPRSSDYLSRETPPSPSAEALARREERRQEIKNASLPELLLESGRVLLQDKKNIMIGLLSILILMLALRGNPPERDPRTFQTVITRSEVPTVTVTQVPLVATTEAAPNSLDLARTYAPPSKEFMAPEDFVASEEYVAPMESRLELPESRSQRYTAPAEIEAPASAAQVELEETYTPSVEAIESGTTTTDELSLETTIESSIIEDRELSSEEVSSSTSEVQIQPPVMASQSSSTESQVDTASQTAESEDPCASCSVSARNQSSSSVEVEAAASQVPEIEAPVPEPRRETETVISREIVRIVETVTEVETATVKVTATETQIVHTVATEQPSVPQQETIGVEDATQASVNQVVEDAPSSSEAPSQQTLEAAAEVPQAGENVSPEAKVEEAEHEL